MLIGLSLSGCVRDIASGAVNESDVDCIIAGTCYRTEGGFYDVLERYSETYWKKYPEAAGIARRLVREGKVIQPRTEGNEPPNVAQGCWMQDGKIVNF